MSAFMDGYRQGRASTAWQPTRVEQALTIKNAVRLNVRTMLWLSHTPPGRWLNSQVSAVVMEELVADLRLSDLIK